jgi:hypothetical protein
VVVPVFGTEDVPAAVELVLDDEELEVLVFVVAVDRDTASPDAVCTSGTD